MLPLASLLACSLPANAQDVPSAYRGIWKQERISCTGETPLEPVRELEFLNDGEFLVTYQPFENYHDFWGDVSFDATTSAFALTIRGGNRIPTLVDLTGTAHFENAMKLATDPLGPLPEKTDPVQAAAMTVVSNVLLNLDEMFLKR